jgi:hypothetical protein
MSGSVRGNWYYPPATVPLSLLLRNQIRHQSRDIYLHTHTGPSRSEHSQCDGSREWAIQIISVSEYWFSVVCGRDYGRNELLCNLTGVVRISIRAMPPAVFVSEPDPVPLWKFPFHTGGNIKVPNFEQARVGGSCRLEG